MERCQYSGCGNFGERSCNGSGRLICGAHQKEKSGPWVYCTECADKRRQGEIEESQRRQQVFQAQARKKEEAERSGCRTICPRVAQRDAAQQYIDLRAFFMALLFPEGRGISQPLPGTSECIE